MASKNDSAVALPEEDAPAISVPDSGDTGEGGKLKMIVQLVKKCLGVKDIAAMRLSLPASLLEPIPNLEFSQLLDRPDIFAAINDYDDPFERMLAVIRFTATKDLKYIRGKVCKPYNSVLGEHFRTHWDVPPVLHPTESGEPPEAQILVTAPSLTSLMPPEALLSETASIKSAKSGLSSKSFMSSRTSLAQKSPSTAATSPQQLANGDISAKMSQLNLGESPEDEKLRIVYLTEQISHHPPISAYYAVCPDRSVELLGIDQISAKVSGTTLKVGPGSMNKGMFVNITGGHGEGERYQITHPIASVNGILRGSFYITVSDSTIITCTGGRHGQKFRTIIEYKEESWLGKAHFLLEGVIHTVFEGETQHEEWTKVKHVPPSRVVAVFDGSWRGLIRWKRVGTGSYPAATSSSASSPNPSHIALPSPSNREGGASKADLPSTNSDYTTLIDLSTLWVIPKQVRPIEKQLPNESRRLWEGVTSRLLKKDFSEATKEKVAIEQKQRDDAADRKKKGVEFVPRYFEMAIDTGVPTLTEEGHKAVEEELKEKDDDFPESQATTPLA